MSSNPSGVFFNFYFYWINKVYYTNYFEHTCIFESNFIVKEKSKLVKVFKLEYTFIYMIMYGSSIYPELSPFDISRLIITYNMVYYFLKPICYTIASIV